MKGIVQPSSSKVRTAETLRRGRESEWDIKVALIAPSDSPEPTVTDRREVRGRALFAECSLLFLSLFSLLYGVCLIIFQILFYVLSLWNLTTSLPLLFRSVPFVFGRGSVFCLDHDHRMFFQPWIVCINEDVNRDYVRGINFPWQCLHYTLGWKFVINDSQLLSWFP